MVSRRRTSSNVRWRGTGLWRDSGGHQVSIAAIPTSKSAVSDSVVVEIENGNHDWSGRGRVRDDSMDAHFNNGMALSAKLSSDGCELQWSNGLVWNRPISEAAQPDLAAEPQSTASPVQDGGNDKFQHEVRLLHSYLDHSLAVLLLLVAVLLHWHLLPFAALPLALAVAVGFSIGIIGTAASCSFDVLDRTGATLLLINVAIIVPFNAICFVLFYLTWPVRLPLYRFFQFVTIPLMTFLKVRVSLSEATFIEWMKILPIAYDKILPSDRALKPFDNVDEATQEQVAMALKNATFMKWLNSFCKSHIPVGVLDAFVFRLIFFMVMIPTLGWFLVGQCFIPLLPVRHEKGHMEGSTEQAKQKTSEKLPPVGFYMPKCRFLKLAREEWGEQTGRQKCLNE